MALNENAVYTAAMGYVFIQDVSTATKPTATEIESFTPGTPPTGWTNIGHTARDELPEFGYDGGETETRGTWQNESLKTVVTSAAVDYVTINLHQFDNLGLELYYGAANATPSTAGTFTVTDTTQKIQKALLIIVVDGETNVGFYAGKTDIGRDDSISMETDQFAALPVRATVLNDANSEKFSWISEDTGVNPS